MNEHLDDAELDRCERILTACTCIDDYKNRGRVDPQCQACDLGAEVIDAFRALRARCADFGEELRRANVGYVYELNRAEANAAELRAWREMLAAFLSHGIPGAEKSLWPNNWPEGVAIIADALNDYVIDAKNPSRPNEESTI